jgi:DNA-binding transcriptional MerR regulator
MGGVRDDLPVLVTTSEAAILAHVEPVTIRQWELRGKIRPAGQTSSGHLLYDVADVFAVTRRDRSA